MLRFALTLLLLSPSALGAPSFYESVSAGTAEVLVDNHLNGSAFLVEPPGSVLTAAHMVPDADSRIEIRLRDGSRLPATRVALDRGNDVALLEVRPPPGLWPSLKFAETFPPPPSPVYLMGTPIYRHGVLLSGTVAREDSTFEFMPNEQLYLKVIHLSAASPPGTSGGPWVDGHARVVGLQSGLMHDGGKSVGIAYMIPVESLKALVLSRKDAETSTIGVGFEEIWEQSQAVLNRFPPRQEGLLVARVRAGGPAEAAGLRVGDLVTHVEDRPIRLRDELLARVRALPPGSTLALTLRRGTQAPIKLSVRTAWLERLAN